ncbi:hypothetical protein ES705_50899 [subsurface metagenome]
MGKKPFESGYFVNVNYIGSALRYILHHYPEKKQAVERTLREFHDYIQKYNIYGEGQINKYGIKSPFFDFLTGPHNLIELVDSLKIRCKIRDNVCMKNLSLHVGKCFYDNFNFPLRMMFALFSGCSL